MPYIIYEAWFPAAITQEVTDRYMKAIKQYPFEVSLGNETVPVAATSGKKGAKILSIMEVKEGKLEEALRFVGKRSFPLQSVNGYEAKTRVWNTLTEALEPLGMRLPPT